MKSPARILVIASSILLTLAPLRGLTAQPNTRPVAGHWGCTSLQTADTIYVSATWDGAATMQAVTAAFANRLATKYGYKGHASCSRADMAGSTFAKIEADAEKQFAAWEKSGKKVIPTGWTYGPAKKADTTAAAKPPATSP
jgi:hypothetical protein